MQLSSSPEGDPSPKTDARKNWIILKAHNRNKFPAIKGVDNMAKYRIFSLVYTSLLKNG